MAEVPVAEAAGDQADEGAEEGGTAPDAGAAPGRRLVGPAVLGAALVWVLFLVVLTYGRADLVHPETFGNFYDAQTRALLDGHLDVDPDVVGFEGFEVGGRTYIYQGIVPALARLPVLAVTHVLDGRLTALSSAAAMAVALGHLVVLVLTARRAVRGDAPVGRAERWWVGATVAALGATPLLFLAAKAWVYHEALLWGAALTLASLTHLLRWVVRVRSGDDRLGPLVWSGLFAVLALNTRLPTGMGALAALGLVGLALLVGVVARGRAGWDDRLRRWVGWAPPRRAAGALVVLVATAVVGLGGYAAVNHARFGTFFGLPIAAQGVASSDDDFRLALEDNGGSLFGLRYTPSVLWQLVRPDSVGLRGEFPFLGFPDRRPVAVGDVRFAERDWSTSLPTSSTLAVVLGAVGVVALVRPRRWSDAGGAVVGRPVVLGAAASLAGIGVLGYIANRYQVDVLPGILVAAALGLHAVGGRARSGGARRALIGVAVLGALWGAWLNTSVALQYQREIAAGAWDGGRAAWLSAQARLGPDPDVVRIGPARRLPPAGPPGQVLVVGDCRAVYRSDGEIWLFVEGTAASGSWDVTVRSTGELTAPAPVLEGSGPTGTNRLVVEPDGPPGRAHLQVEVTADGVTRKAFPGPPFDWVPGSELHLRTQFDWRSGSVEVRDRADRRLLGAVVDMVPTGPVRPARDRDAPVTVTGTPRRATACRILDGS